MEDKKPEENKMEIEISKYKNLVDALGDPVRVARMVLLIAAVATILAIGIVGVVYGIKRFYPYKSINSNPYGATIIQDEDNEIIYWLFNTADLWANSGIEVNEGDIISVRTSGAFHTAIHHLVNDADNNTKMKNLWVSSKGGGLTEMSPLFDRDKARLKFCIAPDFEYNTILMQVVPSAIGGDKGNLNWRTNTKHACYVDGLPDTLYNDKNYFESGVRAKPSEADIYEIGSGKENIRIRTNGVLHFAVNDIALTPRVIKQIQKFPNYVEIMGIGEAKGVWFATITTQFCSLFTKKGLELIKPSSKKRVNNKDKVKWSDTIISSEEWNLQHFKHLGLVNEEGHPIKKYWKEEVLEDSIIENMFRYLDDSTFLKQKYSNNSIWSNIADLKCMKLIKTDTISLKDTLKVKYYGYNADSILNDEYQHQLGFTQMVRDNYPIRDSISLQDSSLIRHTININKNKISCYYAGLYLKEQKLLKQVRQPNEIDYYKYTNFVDAWFADNIGSFMIVIERKNVR